MGKGGGEIYCDRKKKGPGLAANSKGKGKNKSPRGENTCYDFASMIVHICTVPTL